MVDLVRYLTRYDLHDTSRDWMDAAACRDGDPDMWFPAPSDEIATEAARAVCRACPVVTTCRDYAIPQPGLEGIWGGLTPDQRQQIRTRT